MREKQSIGFYVSGHPLDRYGVELARFRSVVSAGALAAMDPWSRVRVGGMVEGYRERIFKGGGGKVAFFVLEDQSGRVEVKVRQQQIETYAARAHQQRAGARLRQSELPPAGRGRRARGRAAVSPRCSSTRRCLWPTPSAPRPSTWPSTSASSARAASKSTRAARRAPAEPGGVLGAARGPAQGRERGGADARAGVPGGAERRDAGAAGEAVGEKVAELRSARRLHVPRHLPPRLPPAYRLLTHSPAYRTGSGSDRP